MGILLGCSETDITPLQHVHTVGFGREDNLSRGVGHELSVQVSVWRSGDVTCCLASIDHIGFSREHTDALRNQIGAILSTDIQRVMLCFAHTHSAPNDSIEVEYFEMVRERLLDCVRAALADMSQVKVGLGCGCADIGVNRRAESTWLDRRVGIIKAVRPNGSVKLLLLRITAHANSLKADNYLISPDYFGDTRDMLREKYGCQVMLTQGASGNIAPKYFDSVLTPPDAPDNRFVRSKTALHDMAAEINRAVDSIADDIALSEECALDMYSRFIELQSDVPNMTRAREIADEAYRFCGIDGTGWLNEVGRLTELGIKEQVERIEVQYFRLGDGCLCGVPNEIMCEFALRAEELTGNPNFYLSGYTNGCMGYFPTAEEFDLGGYEVYWSMLIYYIYYGRVFPLRRDSDKLLIDFSVNSYRK